MMKQTISAAVTLIAAAAATGLASCSSNDAKQAFKPDITGRAGEVLVVINKAAEQDTAGRVISRILGQEYLGLPMAEPIFEMQAVPHVMFDPDLNMHKLRNIVIVDIADTVSTDTIAFYKETWAKQQAVIRIMGKDVRTVADIANRNEIKIVSFLVKAERDRLIKYYGRIKSGANMSEVSKRWGVNMTIPNMFDQCKPARKGTISWFMSDTDEYSDGLMVYTYAYTGPESMTKEALIAHRDSALYANIIGPNNSRMKTDTTYPDEMVYKYGQRMQAGHDVAELRGLWRMEGAAMGGPFLMRAVLDEANNRVVVTDGYVYYPSREMKRNHIRQLEAVMYTLTF